MIQNIWAVGRNYSEHAKELGNAIPSEPLLFLKAGSCATHAEKELRLQPNRETHYETELALRFDEKLQITSACIALDLTDRSLQDKLKSKGQPWTLAKSFKESCPLSAFFPVSSIAELQNLEIKLTVNGELRQHANTSDMIFPIERLLQDVKNLLPVVPGDLFLTGTPAGVGPIRSGDLLEAEIVGKMKHSWKAR